MAVYEHNTTNIYFSLTGRKEKEIRMSVLPL
jgi:hypothetical protein